MAAILKDDNLQVITIGPAADPDLLTLTDTVVTVAGEISVTTLDIGGVNVGATPAEIDAACDASARTAAAVVVADDHFLFCDAAATGVTRVESIVDLATAQASTGLTAANGAFTITPGQTTITSVINASLGKIGTAADQEYVTFGTSNEVNTFINNTERLSVTAAGADVTGDLTISGDLTVSGDTVTTNVATVTVEDPMIKLASGNGAGDTVDIGFYGLCDPGGSQDTFTGLVRDATDAEWHLFDLLQTEPTTTMNKSATGFDHADLTVGALTADDASTFTTGLTTAALTATANLDIGAYSLRATQFTSDIADGTAPLVVTSTTEVANLNAATATLATNVTVSANNSTNETVYPVFVDAATGTQGAETDTGLTYNPSTGLLTATTLAGTISTAAQNTISSATSLAAVGALAAGSIAATFGHIDNGTSNITTGGVLKVDVDGSAINGAGTLTFGAGNDASLYWDGGSLVIDTASSSDIAFEVAGTEVASLDTDGLSLASGDAYQIAGTSVLNASTLGSGVTASSLTSVGTLTALTVDDVAVNGKVITMTGDTSDTVTMTAAGAALFTIATSDNAGTDGHIVLDADGDVKLDAATGITRFMLAGDTDDLCTLTVAANGVTTLATADSDGVVGHFTLDVDGDIVLDADAGTITFKDGGSSLGTVTSAGWTGDVVGDVTGDVTGNADTATLATSITATANNTANETVYLTFVDGVSGTQGIETDSGLTYNPLTGMLTATTLAGTLSTAAQTAVTSLGTLTALVTSGGVNLVDGGDGAINGCVIGGATAAAGTFTTLDCTNGAFALANLDIDGGSEIGAALVDADLIIVDDGAGGANRKCLMSRVKTYIDAVALSTANTFTAKQVIDLPLGNITPATDGSHLHIEGGVTMTDDNTSGSGTAAAFNQVSIEAVTLAATNSSVTTTNAATLAITAAPTAGTNQTLTNSFALMTGTDGAGADVKFFGGASDEFLLWDASENALSIENDAAGTTLLMGGDAVGDYAITVGDGTDQNADKIRATAFITHSDENLKKDIQVMKNPMDKLNKLQGVTYNWKKGDKKAKGWKSQEVGFVAQDVRKVLPQIVAVADDGGMGIDYSKLTAVLTEAVKQQDTEIKNLRTTLSTILESQELLLQKLGIKK